MWIVRTAVPGLVHHIIWRCIDRDYLIIDDVARAHYLRLLARAMRDSDWLCLAFAIMTNHVHLAMLAGELPAERWYRRVHPPFANWTNKRLERVGPVFAESPTMWVVRRENERRLIAYIHNNPVRAGVVARARDSSWTSHRAYLGLVEYDWLDAEMALARLELGPSAFEQLVDSDVGYRPETERVEPVRKAARTRGAIEVGTPLIERSEVPLVARPFAHLRADPRRIVDVTGDIIGIDAAHIRSLDRSPRIVAARTLVVHAGRALGLPLSWMAATLGISAQRASSLSLRALTTTDRAVVEVVRDRIEDELRTVLAPRATLL